MLASFVSLALVQRDQLTELPDIYVLKAIIVQVVYLAAYLVQSELTVHLVDLVIFQIVHLVPEENIVSVLDSVLQLATVQLDIYALGERQFPILYPSHMALCVLQAIIA